MHSGLEGPCPGKADGRRGRPGRGDGKGPARACAMFPQGSHEGVGGGRGLFGGGCLKWGGWG